MPLNPEYVVLHCTASSWGTVESIRRYHMTPESQGGPKGGPWSDIGYHYVITNPYANPGSIGKPDIALDGMLWKGRDLDHDGDVEEEIGAHVHGWNRKSLGVALVGQRIRNEKGIVLGSTFTSAQIREALRLIRDICMRHEIAYAKVVGHYEVHGVAKTCPDLDMDWFRDLLRAA